MSEENEPRTPGGEDKPRVPLREGRIPLPGVMAISLYLLLMAGTIVAGVVGHHYTPVYLIFAVVFVTASPGLLMGFRWAWALALSATFLLMTFDLWNFAAQHQTAMAVQGILNLV